MTQNTTYLHAAEQAQSFIEKHLSEKNSLFVSWRDGRRSGKGFLDDYTNEIFALLSLYESTLDNAYLSRAKTLCDKCLCLFQDENGYYFEYGCEYTKINVKDFKEVKD
jgi:uncharacterized protein YyaL (SSP411 family)